MPQILPTTYFLIVSDRLDKMDMSGNIVGSAIPGITPIPPVYADCRVTIPATRSAYRCVGLTTNGVDIMWTTVTSLNIVGYIKKGISDLGAFSNIPNPYGIAIDLDGNAWVTSRTTNNVYKLSAIKNNLLGNRRKFSVGKGPTGIACDRFGNVWVSNSNSNDVTKLAQSGSLIGHFHVPNMPQGLATDSQGNAWVATSGSGIIKLDPNGTITANYGPGLQLYGVALDARGNIWATEPRANKAHKFSPNSAHYDSFPVGHYPTGISADSFGNVWVTNTMDNSITKLSNDGTIIGTFHLPTTRGPFNFGDTTGFAYRKYVLGEQ